MAPVQRLYSNEMLNVFFDFLSPGVGTIEENAEPQAVHH